MGLPLQLSKMEKSTAANTQRDSYTESQSVSMQTADSTGDNIKTATRMDMALITGYQTERSTLAQRKIARCMDMESANTLQVKDFKASLKMVAEMDTECINMLTET